MNGSRITLLKGGWSVEREVSLVSGAACAEALRSEGYDVTEYDVTRDISALVAALNPKPDAVFNALHGRFGEDGNVQGLLNMLDIPYTHSGVLASAMAMDKDVARRAFANAGLPVAEAVVMKPEALAHGDPLARPYVVKPVDEGSSCGVHIVRAGDNGPSPSEFGGFRRVLVERFIPGREITVAVMDDKPMTVTELVVDDGFYDYEAKYTEGRTRHICPAELPVAALDQAMGIAETAHRTLGCRGVSRADLRFDDSAGPDGMFLLEVNTQPGMTPLSLVPEQAAYQGTSFGALVRWMVEHAACD